MAALDKWHFLSTYKVKICPLSHGFPHLFFEKESNHGYFLPIHNPNPKNYILHLQFLESMWSKTLFDNYMILGPLLVLQP
jgi:hypothetical protein